MASIIFNTEEKINDLVHQYNVLKKSSLELSRHHKVDPGTILRTLRRNGVKIRTHVNHTLNDGYFNRIDTEEKAYFLGFLYADGCVLTHQSSMEMSIGLSSKDGYMLEWMKKQLEYTGPIGIYEYKREGKDYDDAHLLRCKSNGLCSDLIRLGCIPRKSLVLRWPEKGSIPEHLMHHFIRGYFDGDGHFTFWTKEGRISQLMIGFSGTESFLNDLEHYLVEHVGVNRNKVIKDRSKAYTLRHTGNKVAHKIGSYLYKDATIYLTRKHDKWMSTTHHSGNE